VSALPSFPLAVATLCADGSAAEGPAFVAPPFRAASRSFSFRPSPLVILSAARGPAADAIAIGASAVTPERHPRLRDIRNSPAPQARHTFACRMARCPPPFVADNIAGTSASEKDADPERSRRAVLPFSEPLARRAVARSPWRPLAQAGAHPRGPPVAALSFRAVSLRSSDPRATPSKSCLSIAVGLRPHLTSN